MKLPHPKGSSGSKAGKFALHATAALGVASLAQLAGGHGGDAETAKHAYEGLGLFLGFSAQSISDFLVGVSHAFAHRTVDVTTERHSSEHAAFDVLGKSVLLILHTTKLPDGPPQAKKNELIERIRENWHNLHDDVGFGEFLGQVSSFNQDSLLDTGQWQALLTDQALATTYFKKDPNLPVLAEQIVKKLPTTYRKLLSMDEHAYREVTLGLQLANRLDDVKLPPLSNFDNLREEREEHEGRTDGELLFYYQLSSFVGRDDAWKWLSGFLDDGEIFRWARMTGSGGMGKSRIALHLCLQRPEWHAGFLDKQKNVPEWRDWIPTRDTLIVVDYANEQLPKEDESWSELMFEIYNRLHSQPFKVRFLLLGRSDGGPDWDRALPNNFRGAQALYDLGWGPPDELSEDKVKAMASAGYWKKPFRLLDLSPSAFRLLVASEILRLGAESHSSGQPDLSVLDRLDERLKSQEPLRPLFALFVARAIRAGEDVAHWTATELVRNVLKIEKDRRKKASLADAWDNALLWATVTGFLDFRERPEIAPLSLWKACVLPEPNSEELALCAALTEGSDPRGYLLGPIKPDLLGELFVLDRLNGGIRLDGGGSIYFESDDQLIQVTEALISRAAAVSPDQLQAFIRRAYQSYGPSELTRRLISFASSQTKLVLAFLAGEAYRTSPSESMADFQLWQDNGDGRERYAGGLLDATVGEPNPAKCLDIAKQIERIHEAFGQEPAVREQWAKAFFNATVGEPNPAKCLDIAKQIERIHEAFGQEPAVREQWAKALFNATVGEPNPAKCLDIAKQIERIHEAFGQEPAVREQWATALYNATVGEPNPAKCLDIAKQIERIHEAFGQEPAVREQWATALYNATVGEPNPAKRLDIANQIERIHEAFGQEPAVRERWAKALFNATVGEPNPAKCLDIANQIERIHEAFGQEPAVREQWAKALCKATVGEPDAARRLDIAKQIERIHEAFGQEPAVREQWAEALFNATVDEPDPAKCLDIAKQIERIHEAFGQEPAVREQWAKALYNATVGEPNPAKCLDIAKQIERIHEAFGQEPAVREQWATALYNATVGEPNPAKRLDIAKQIERIHEAFGQEPAVREQWAKALYNASQLEPDLEERKRMRLEAVTMLRGLGFFLDERANNG